MADKLNSADMQAGYNSAKEDVNSVGSDLQDLAQQMRFKVLDGPDRQNFINTMTQDEFSALHQAAQTLGPRGLMALERIVNEAQ